MSENEFSLLQGIAGLAYSAVDFQDAEESRPTAVSLEALGGNQDAIQGIVQLSLNRHVTEALPITSPLAFGSTSGNWRKRLREMMIKQNETVLSFLLKPSSEHPIIGPVQKALMKYAVDQDIDNKSLKSLKDLLKYFSQGQIQSQIQSEIEECIEKRKGKDYGDARVGLGTSSATEPGTSLTVLKNQVRGLVELYKETGEKLMESENQLKFRLEKMDKLQRRISTVIELQTNEAIPEVVSALETYLRIAFRDLTIETHYKDLLFYYQKHFALREAIHMFRSVNQSTNESLCSICLNDPVGMAIVPCGHTFCLTCTRKMSMECYICRGKIKERMKLFFS